MAINIENRNIMEKINTVENQIADQTTRSTINIILRGAGQVMFQNNAWTGLLFICAIFWGAFREGESIVAWGALLGLVASTVTGYILRLPKEDGSQGLWGFNGILVGCAFPTFLGTTTGMWIALIICAAMTTWVRSGMNNVMAPWKVNSFTFPFVFCTWIFLLAARAMQGIPVEHLTDPALPSHFTSLQTIPPLQLIEYWLKGVAQVFLIDSWEAGILILIGLAISNRWAALWAAIGSAVALLSAIAFRAAGSDVSEGMYSFSPVLTAIALATVFYQTNWRSALWALMGIIVTVFVQAAMNIIVEPLGIPTLTGPFCIATWLFLLPMIRLDYQTAIDHSNWDEHTKPHLARGHKKAATAKSSNS